MGEGIILCLGSSRRPGAPCAPAAAWLLDQDRQIPSACQGRDTDPSQDRITRLSDESL
jgi:hypothetical protein